MTRKHPSRCSTAILVCQLLALLFSVFAPLIQPAHTWNPDSTITICRGGGIIQASIPLDTGDDHRSQLGHTGHCPLCISSPAALLPQLQSFLSPIAWRHILHAIAACHHTQASVVTYYDTRAPPRPSPAAV
ncbi:MAG: DUF2946 family protein [Lautropia sp.]|nr:DUF2946 family protein [Lautropia sp.]